LIIILVFFIGVRCGTRSEKPIILTDSTITYPSKKVDGISATLTLCRKIDKKSGKRIGAGTGFTIIEKNRVHVLADILNRKPNEDRKLMFHFNWIGPDGKSLFTKRIDILPNDSSSTIRSAISISSETRPAGEYTIQLYFFRELIAEKKFEIFPRFNKQHLIGDTNAEIISLYRKFDKKTRKYSGEDTTFIIRKKEKVRAYVDFENRSDYGNRELMFRFDWTAAKDSVPFYKKQVNILPNDTTTLIGSSVSISPGKRSAGDYILKLYLFNELIGVKHFKLLPEPKIVPVSASILFCQKLDKKSGKPIGEGTKFTIGNKKKLRAYIKIRNRSAYEDKKMNFVLEWIGPDGKVFYKKKIGLAANDMTSVLKSSISISPDKKQSGDYLLKVSLFKKVIAKKAFVLVE